MAQPGEEIRGTLSTIRFLETTEQTGGERVVVEIAYRGQPEPPPVHYHPNQDEEFEVLEGEIHARLDGEELVLHAGERLLVPAGTRHQMWSTAPARQRWQTRPALNTERFFETLWGLQQDGRSNESGVPGLLQMSLSLRHFSDEFRVVSPSRPVQAWVVPLLGLAARVRGLTPEYRASPRA